MKKTTVVYHSADYDGIFCREIARKFLPDAELIGWNFGDKPLPQPTDGSGMYYVLDLPVDKVFGIRFEDGWIARDNPIMSKEERQVQPLDRCSWSNIIWIDHHKSSIETHPADIPGYRIDGVAACRLAWQWFTAEARLIAQHSMNPDQIKSYPFPLKQDYIDRAVSEPLAVRLAGEYDIWDKRDPDAETLQYGLRFVEQGSDFWEALLETDDVGMKAVQDILGHGKICQSYQRKIDTDLVKHRSYRLQWEGLNWIVLNTGRFNSLTFAALDVPKSGHDALLGYMFNGKAWTVSLYHAKHRTDLDLSMIAVKHGGGGHRGACGFTCKTLPF